jgi:CDP-6-deoxy-D-xylo-4-hexulose-3-dehydrase
MSRATSSAGANRRDRFDAVVSEVQYDAKYVFDTLGYNLLGSEVSAAFGLAQLDRLDTFIQRRQRNVARLAAGLGPCTPTLLLPRQRSEVTTAWHAFPLVVRQGAPFSRRALQAHLEARGIQTRPVLAGNLLRQPAMAGVPHRIGPGGTPNSDAVFLGGLLVGCHQGLDDDEVDTIIDAVTAVAGG